MPTPAFRDPALPLNRRLDDLIARMTIEEMVGQLMQLPGTHQEIEAWAASGRLGSTLCVVGQQIVGPQRAALGSRLGIPLLVGIDAIHGHSMEHGATMFPSQLGLACAWSEDLAERVARATAAEIAHTGIHWNFSPLLCLPRDLRWGRTGETFGEDGLLIGRLGAAMVRGYQGGDLADPLSVAACAKHYAGYGDSEGGRDASDSGHSRRTMRAVFLPPFEAVAKAGVASWMTAYHAIDGVSCVYNRWLLTDVLRGEWDSDGLVVTDWDIVQRNVRNRRLDATTASAARRTLLAGNDLIMTSACFYDDCLAEFAAGRIPRAAIEQACRRVLTLKFRLGLFENPRLPDATKAAQQLGRPEHRALAVESARRSLVLLKNRQHTLPVARAKLRRIAVIGPNSDDVLGQLGDWSLAAGQSQGPRDAYPRERTVTVLDGLTRLAGPGIEVVHAIGCGMPAPLTQGSPVRYATDRVGDGRHESAPQQIAHAVRLAAGSDLAVVVLGDAIHYIGESKSTATLELIGDQQALFDAVAATGVPLVAVLVTSKPLAIPRVVARADAVICVFNPGMEGGTAIAEAIFGDLEPQGRLTISWPHHVGQQPVRYDQCPGAHQGGYPDLPDVGLDPLFAFGFGLSYTTVRYQSLRVASATLAAGQALEAEVTVRNSGLRPCVETVQAYLGDLVTSVTWPGKRLKAWTQVALQPGEQRVVRLRIEHAELALCDEHGRWVVEPGGFQLLVGPSSRDADLQRVAFSVTG